MDFKKWRFPLIVAAWLVAFELAAIGASMFGAPTGYRWLGNTIFNSSDQAVYLNYLSQGAHGILLVNLFDNHPQIARFDLFWSLGGLLVRAGIPVILAHEILRWICTIVLAFALVATARAVTQNEKQARLATLFMVSGMSTGWIYVIYKGMSHTWTPMSGVTADLATEFATAPVLLGGAHMILSFALQLLALRWIWEILRDTGRKPWAACAVLLILSFFHPYFIPVFGLVSIMAMLIPHHKSAIKLSKRLLYFFTINAAMLPGFVYYVWMMLSDHDFRVHHLSVNYLPLDPVRFWLVTLTPILIAGIYLSWRGISKEHAWIKRPDWILAWLAAALLCMVLPFPWKRKFTQALLPALVILTLPFWLLLADKARTLLIRPVRWLVVVLLLFPLISLFRTQTMTPYSSEYFTYFFAPQSQLNAWLSMASSMQDGTVIATSLTANIWTPAYANKTVWIGHNHETPDNNQRLAQFKAWQAEEEPNKFAEFLDERNITTVLAVNATDTRRCSLALKTPWQKTFEENGISVWTKPPKL